MGTSDDCTSFDRKPLSSVGQPQNLDPGPGEPRKLSGGDRLLAESLEDSRTFGKEGLARSTSECWVQCFLDAGRVGFRWCTVEGRRRLR